MASEAANRARELQNLPSNVATPSYLADRALEIAGAHETVTVEVLGRAEIEQRGMGGLAAVAKGTAEEPALIALRYRGGAEGETLGLVGKAVTFDTGGISIKPSQKMEEMKMDMSGGAAVLEGVGAIAELGLPLNVVACVPATENMPSGTATKPGDIVTQLNGKTVEVNNTDAEGRLILADALTYCVRELGADRLVDLATLTGAVLIALGSTYAALISNDDEWAQRRAGGRASKPGSWPGACRCIPSTRSSPEGRTPTSRMLRRSARRGRSTRARSLRSSWTASPGRTSTSPGPPGTSGASTWAPGRPASGCGCWWRWQATSQPPKMGLDCHGPHDSDRRRA